MAIAERGRALHSIIQQRGFDDAGQCFDAQRGFIRQSMIVHKAHKTARAIAALLHFAAVGIEYPVAKIHIGTRRFVDQQNLIAADAEMSIRDITQLRRREIDGLVNRVEHDKVIAQAVHFGEA